MNNVLTSKLVLVVGAGRAGVGIGTRLASGGVDVAFLTRRPIAGVSGIPAFTISSPGVPLGVGVVILAIPDRLLTVVARQLHNAGIIRERTVVVHLSGAMDSSILDGVLPDGIGKVSAHPLHAFGPAEPPRPMREGILVTIEGNMVSPTKEIRELFEMAGAQVIDVNTSDRPKIHAAAVLVSNLSGALVLASARMFGAVGLPDAIGLSAGLLGDTANNFYERRDAMALTGPLIRGDIRTIASNIEAIRQVEPKAIEAYSALTRYLYDFLRHLGKISEEQWKKIDEMMS